MKSKDVLIYNSHSSAAVKIIVNVSLFVINAFGLTLFPPALIRFRSAGWFRADLPSPSYVVRIQICTMTMELL